MLSIKSSIFLAVVNSEQFVGRVGVFWLVHHHEQQLSSAAQLVRTMRFPGVYSLAKHFVITKLLGSLVITKWLLYWSCFPLWLRSRTFWNKNKILGIERVLCLLPSASSISRNSWWTALEQKEASVDNASVLSLLDRRRRCCCCFQAWQHIFCRKQNDFP